MSKPSKDFSDFINRNPPPPEFSGSDDLKFSIIGLLAILSPLFFLALIIFGLASLF
jgi:hypothetical protein